jgi:hypothetical protein
MRRSFRSALVKLAVLAAAGGCSGESALAPHGAAGGAEATGSGGASGSGGELDFGGAPGTGGAVGTGGRAGTGGAIPPAVPADVSATVDIAAHHQVLIGFGAAIAYYVNFLANRNLPGDDLPTVLFPELGLDILRVGNWYQTQSATATSPQTAFSDFDTVAVVQKATAALGHAPRILMSSWSPPAYLKSNSATKAATPGTLAKVGGAYQYAAFGQWWAASLAAYASYGVKPDYISIQNEPDYFNSGWETCLFDATEGPSNAGFGPALDAVYDAVHNAPAIAPKPAILGPEQQGPELPGRPRPGAPGRRRAPPVQRRRQYGEPVAGRVPDGDDRR